MYAANFVISSDRQKKTDIRTYTGGAAVADAVEPQRYERFDTPGVEYVGFIAQDIQAVLPEAVDMLSDNTLGLKQMPIVAALWSALRETRAELQELKNKIG